MPDEDEKTDERFMREALRQARMAGARGEVPIGAVVVRQGSILAGGYNRPVMTQDPTAHAEVVAIRKAARKTGNYRLRGCDLYVTVEPCAMCLGALLQARIRRLVYGADDPKAGVVRSIIRFPVEKTNHSPDLRGGILADESARLLRDFFRALRRKSAAG